MALSFALTPVSLLSSVKLAHSYNFSFRLEAFWRIVLGINLLYELALVFLLFQDVDSARAMMKYIDPSLGKPLPEKSYAENCEFTLHNIWVSRAWFVPARILECLLIA